MAIKISGKRKEKPITAFVALFVAMFIVMASIGVMAVNSVNETASEAITNPVLTADNPVMVDLGTAGDFAILAESGISTTEGTDITGDIGVSSAESSLTGPWVLSLDTSGEFSTSPLITGRVYAYDYMEPTPTMLTTAVGDKDTAYADASSRVNATGVPDYLNEGNGVLEGLTLYQGIHKWTDSVSIGLTTTGDVTLDAEGDPDAVFILQIPGTLDIGSGADVPSGNKVLLTNGASASNIFWAVAGAVTLGTFSTFEGNILTGATSHIAIQTGAVLNGRALSDGAVTLDANKVTTPSAIATFDIILTADDDADSWNFVSFNIIPVSTSLETILDDISGSYDKVMYYDAATDEWNSYVPGRAEHFNNLADWNHHMGLWIHATVNDTLTVTGTVPASTDITLYPGWNMVGLPSTSAGNHGLPVEVTRIGYFNATTEYNVAYDYEPWNYTFEASKGYWIHNPTAGNLVWTVNY